MKSIAFVAWSASAGKYSADRIDQWTKQTLSKHQPRRLDDEVWWKYRPASVRQTSAGSSASCADAAGDGLRAENKLINLIQVTVRYYQLSTWTAAVGGTSSAVLIAVFVSMGAGVESADGESTEMTTVVVGVLDATAADDWLVASRCSGMGTGRLRADCFFWQE